MIIKRIALSVLIIVVVGVAAAVLAAMGLLRPIYFTALTEARLLWRGQSLARIRYSPRDRMSQVYIPAGEFTMGSSGLVGAAEHKVYLHAYWIDQFTVTNAMYQLCVQARKCRHTAKFDTFLDDPIYADYPVHYINWYDAAAFCKWEGGRLPAEAEWEKAARGVKGFHYPWGNARPDPSLLNFNGQFGEPRSAYSYWTGMSPYGLLNMAGNVQQWVADWYSKDYYLHSPYQNPTGPATGELKVLRGGGFWDNATEVSTYYRFPHDPRSAGSHRGVRCVQDGE